MSRCPGRDEFEQLLAERLGDRQREALEAHVEECLACQRLLEQLADDPGSAGRPGPPNGSPEPVPEPDGDFLRQLEQLPPPWARSGPGTAEDGDTPHVRGKEGAPVVGAWPTVAGYAILAELGRGGMGIVYKARHTSLGRLVALKMILAGAQADPEKVARFQREAEAVARLQHPNIVQIYEVGQAAGQSYLALELVDGGSLTDRLAGKPLPYRQAAQLAEALARAVDHAHRHGIVHRDLKPANILLQRANHESHESGDEEKKASDPSSLPLSYSCDSCDSWFTTPKITDFGLAKLLDRPGGQTQSGEVLGTPPYMAPEQAAGKNKEVGPATDVYALGAILYETLTGRPPFQAPTPLETLHQVLSLEPVRLKRLQPQVPRDLETICLKCLHKEPTRRYSTARALADDLRRFLGGEPIQARRTRLPERVWRWYRRNPLLGTLAASVVALLLAATGIGLEIQRQVVADMQAHAAAGLVARLRDAEVSQVPAIVAEMASYRTWTDPQLTGLLEQPEVSPKELLHARLALLPVDPKQVEPLREALLRPETPPPAVLVLRDALQAYQDQFTGLLWERLEDGREHAERRFRAGCALALYDPTSPRWEGVAAVVVEQLVAQNPFFLGGWAEALRPVRRQLLEPLGRVFRDKDRPTERTLATSVLADYAADQPDTLAELVKEADAKQYAVLYPKLKEQGDRALHHLAAEVDKQLPSEATEDAKEKWAKRQANAAVALLRMGQPDKVWPLLQHSPDPRRRTYLIHGLGPLGTDPVLVIKRLEEETDVSARRALILALGHFTAEQLLESLRGPLVEGLLRWYRNDPDPGVHGAIDWLLRHGKEGPAARPLDWGQAQALERIDRERTSRPPEGRRWYVNSQGQTLALIPGPVEFRMGSLEHEPRRLNDETPHRRRIDRSFVLATKYVTVRQFQEFLKAHPEVRHKYTERFSPDPDGPMVGVTWYEAAQYCRWLSEQEGVPEEQMCYPPLAVIEKSSDGETPLKLPEDYLSRTGYRLPTEAEWEYACRAGAETSRYYGEAEEMLGAYAWYAGNAGERAWPVAQKRPNDFGLFDMLGNVWQWCQESCWDYQLGPQGQPAEDREDKRDVNSKESRSMRGGAFHNTSSILRAAYRDANRAPARSNGVGLRPARTYR